MALDPKNLRAKIITELSLESLSEPEQNDVIDKLSEEIFTRMTLVFMHLLPKDVEAEFKNLPQKEFFEKLGIYITQRFPEGDSMAEQVVKETVKEYKKLVVI